MNHGDGQERALGGELAVETLVNMPKQMERKFNVCFMGFKTKEGEIEKELVQQLNIELLHGQMRQLRLSSPCGNGLWLQGPSPRR